MTTPNGIPLSSLSRQMVVCGQSPILTALSSTCPRRPIRSFKVTSGKNKPQAYNSRHTPPKRSAAIVVKSLKIGLWSGTQRCSSAHGASFSQWSSKDTQTKTCLPTCVSLFLHAVITLCPGEATMKQLNDAWVDNCTDLYHNGYEVKPGVKIFFVWLGLKGDWPYLRKAAAVQPGFTSKRVCRLCCGEDWHDLSEDAAWRHERPGGDPLKSNRSVPFFKMPDGRTPRVILLDVVHTFHIGFGVDLCASMIVMLPFMGLLGAGPTSVLV